MMGEVENGIFNGRLVGKVQGKGGRDYVDVSF